MKRIASIKIKEQDFIFDELSSSYIFNPLYLFFLRKSISINNKNIILKGDLIFEFKNIVLNCLTSLIDASYNEPSLKEIQKNPTRFEKIVLYDKVYKVNYRMSEIGRLCYLLYCLSTSLEHQSDNNEILIRFLI